MWYQVVVILALMMVRTALADDELGWVVPHQSNQETLRIVREECQDEEFLDTKEGKLLCTAARAFIPTPSSSTTSPTTEIIPNKPMITTATSEAPASTSPIWPGASEVAVGQDESGASEVEVNRHSTKGDSSTITWAYIGTIFAVVILLVALGFFIRRYTKRAGSHHSTESNEDNNGRAGIEMSEHP